MVAISIDGDLDERSLLDLFALNLLMLPSC